MLNNSPGFVDPTHLDFIFKLELVLYSLKQAPRDWYEILSTFLILNGFIKGKLDTILFTKHVDNDFLIVRIYIDDIYRLSKSHQGQVMRCEPQFNVKSRFKLKRGPRVPRSQETSDPCLSKPV